MKWGKKLNQILIEYQWLESRKQGLIESRFEQILSDESQIKSLFGLFPFWPYTRSPGNSIDNENYWFFISLNITKIEQHAGKLKKEERKTMYN